MLHALYRKSRLGFALVWIGIYCVAMSVGDAVSEAVGIASSISLPIALLLSAVLFGFMKTNGLLCFYGLRRSGTSARSMLYYLPLLPMLAVNLIGGGRPAMTPVEIPLYILTMLCVGFLEEVIFRGLLFRALYENNRRLAVILSSVTFGIGHIINLFNGSGAQLLPNLLQVVYATAAGFMFVMIVCKTDSLWMCIAAHGLFNALSVCSPQDPAVSTQIVSCVCLTVITGAYAVYLAWTMRRCRHD